jgi:hypothetical protein
MGDFYLAEALTLFCHSCGQSLVEHASFCTACGTRVATAPTNATDRNPVQPTVATPGGSQGVAPVVPRRLRVPMQVMTWSLVASWGALLMLFSMAASDGGHQSSAFFAGLLLLMFGGGIAFYVSLGMLAVRLGRSVVLWVGGSMLTSPFGPIFAYVHMQGLVRAQASSTAAG